MGRMEMNPPSPVHPVQENGLDGQRLLAGLERGGGSVLDQQIALAQTRIPSVRAAELTKPGQHEAPRLLRCQFTIWILESVSWAT
jgi:hypothetical protein